MPGTIPTHSSSASAELRWRSQEYFPEPGKTTKFLPPTETEVNTQRVFEETQSVSYFLGSIFPEGPAMPE